MSKLYHYRVSRHVAADPATVWNVISDHADMAEWTPFRRSLLERPGEPHPNGTGAVRALYLVGPPTREQIIGFEPPRQLRYKLLSGLPFRDYVGEVTVEPDGAGARLSTELSFRTRFPGSQVFGPIALRLGTNGAARLAEKRAGPTSRWAHCVSPSKVHLLVSAPARELERIGAKIDRKQSLAAPRSSVCTT